MRLSLPVEVRRKVGGVVIKKWICRSRREFLELSEVPLGVSVFTVKRGWEGILIVVGRLQQAHEASGSSKDRRPRTQRRTKSKRGRG